MTYRPTVSSGTLNSTQTKPKLDLRPSFCFQLTTLGKLFTHTHVPPSRSSTIRHRSRGALIPCGWEGNRIVLASQYGRRATSDCAIRPSVCLSVALSHMPTFSSTTVQFMAMVTNKLPKLQFISHTAQASIGFASYGALGHVPLDFQFIFFLLLRFKAIQTITES